MLRLQVVAPLLQILHLLPHLLPQLLNFLRVRELCCLALLFALDAERVHALLLLLRALLPQRIDLLPLPPHAIRKVAVLLRLLELDVHSPRHAAEHTLELLQLLLLRLGRLRILVRLREHHSARPMGRLRGERRDERSSEARRAPASKASHTFRGGRFTKSCEY